MPVLVEDAAQAVPSVDVKPVGLEYTNVVVTCCFS